MRTSTIPAVHTVRLPDGTALPFAEHGASDGIPVVLLHGGSDSWRSFTPVFEQLPDGIHAYAPTARGHGDADRPAGGYTPVELADDAAAFMDAVGLDRAVVAGHSLGAMVAIHLAARHADRVTGLVLLAALTTPGENPGLLELADAVQALDDPVDRGFVTRFQLSTIATQVPDALLDELIDESCKLPARVWRAVAHGLVTDDTTAALLGVRAPTLAVWGTADALVPRSDQERIVATLPEATLHVYDGTGHALHWERPDRVVADLRAFVARFTG